VNYISYIKEKQKIWAKRNNIELIGSQNTRGERLYVKKLENNLYNNKLSTKTINEYENADGQEFGNNKIPGKMQALHSSSALVINVFEYWKYKNNKDIIAKLLNIPSKNIESIVFEEKFPILKDVTKHPNIDIVFHYKNNGICAIESKFTEPYGRKKEYKIEENSFIIFKTKNSEPGFLENSPEKFIYLAESGAEYLIENDIKGVGIDTNGIERSQSEHPTHKKLLRENIMILEGLRLDQVPAGDYILLLSLLKIAESDGLPGRAYLFEHGEIETMLKLFK